MNKLVRRPEFYDQSYCNVSRLPPVGRTNNYSWWSFIFCKESFNQKTRFFSECKFRFFLFVCFLLNQDGKRDVGKNLKIAITRMKQHTDIWWLYNNNEYDRDWNMIENGNLCTRLSFCTLWPRRSWQTLIRTTYKWFIIKLSNLTCWVFHTFGLQQMYLFDSTKESVWKMAYKNIQCIINQNLPMDPARQHGPSVQYDPIEQAQKEHQCPAGSTLLWAFT